MDKKFKAENISIFIDSALIVNQVNGNFTVANLVMAVYLKKVSQLIKEFKNLEIKQLLEEQNCHTDALANIALFIKSSNNQIFPLELLLKKSITKEEKPKIQKINQGNNNQIEPILQCIQNGTLLADKSEAKKIKIKAAKDYLLDGKLYKISYMGLLM